MRCIVCFESVDGEVQRSEGATLCVCGSESV